MQGQPLILGLPRRTSSELIGDELKIKKRGNQVEEKEIRVVQFCGKRSIDLF